MSKTWIQLGRMGDILNVLPLLWKDAQAGKRWDFMVAAEYVSVLEGVSYVNPVVFDGPHYDIAKAVNGDFLCTQVNGPKEAVAEHVYKPAGLTHAVTTSYQKEMWKVAGRLKEWDLCYPLLFDKRDPERENRLLIDCGLKRGRQKKLILVSTEGNSSPFAYRELLMELVKGRFGAEFNVMPLPKAERIYDLLALYERAYCLVAIDSAPLHLARACPQLPVVALTNDKPLLWNGSCWEPNHVFYCRYGDFIHRAIEMLNAIGDISKRVTTNGVHMWSEYKEKRRFDYSTHWNPLPIMIGMDGRDSANTIQDSQRHPYLKDCLRMAMQKCKDGMLMITRPDTQFTQLFKPSGEPCFSYRMNHADGHSTFSPVVDMLCAKVSWWKAHLDEMPDYIMGSDYYWSHGLWAMFKKYGAADLTGTTYRMSTEIRVKPEPSPRLKQNNALATTYVQINQITSRYPKVTEQIETVAVFSKMTRFGYNPTIIEHAGKIHMAYRYHPGLGAETRLELAELTEDGRLFSVRPLEVAGNSIEDPKFFEWRGALCMSWVDSEWPRAFKAVVKYGMFKGDQIVDIRQPEFPGNDGTTVQKNYVFFERAGVLFCVYQTQPLRVMRLDAVGWVECPNDTSPRWSYGSIRGGTTPVPYEGKWLRFFHGGLDNDFGPTRRRYFMGALIMDQEPPFKVLKVSKTPILYGSEVDDLRVSERPKFWKPNVVFPSGIVVRDGYWLVSIGVNDAACAIVKVREKDLNL